MMSYYPVIGWHANPTHDWTVAELAREAGISRSVLAERFTQLVGESPMRYLAGWRVQLAKQMMREMIEQAIARMGEKVSVRRFVRFKVGESALGPDAASPSPAK